MPYLLLPVEAILKTLARCTARALLYSSLGMCSPLGVCKDNTLSLRWLEPPDILACPCQHNNKVYT